MPPLERQTITLSIGRIFNELVSQWTILFLRDDSWYIYAWFSLNFWFIWFWQMSYFWVLAKCLYVIRFTILSKLAIFAFLYFWKKVFCFWPYHLLCLSVCHHVCDEMAGLSNMVPSEVYTIYKNSKMFSDPDLVDHLDHITFWPTTSILMDKLPQIFNHFDLIDAFS